MRRDRYGVKRERVEKERNRQSIQAAADCPRNLRYVDYDDACKTGEAGAVYQRVHTG